MIRWFREWRRRRALQKQFDALPDGHPEKYLIAIEIYHGPESARACRLAREPWNRSLVPVSMEVADLMNGDAA